MKIKETDDKIQAVFEENTVEYDKKQWGEKQNHLTSSGVVKLPEWKIDLINNHGVELNELQS